MIDKNPYINDMYYCGSNKPVSEQDFTDKIASLVKGDSFRTMPPINVITQYGVKRTGVPVIYSPRPDYSDGDCNMRYGITFNDSSNIEIVKFRLFQLSDENAYLRAAGFKIPFNIDLTESGDLFKRLSLPTSGIIPKGYLYVMERDHPDIFAYTQKFLYNYDRALVHLRTIFRNVIMPLESEKMMWKNLAMRTQQSYEIGGAAQYKEKIVDGLLDDANSMQRRPNIGIVAPDERY